MARAWKIIRGFIVLVSVIVLSTVAINATDNMSNLSNSMVGQVLSGSDSSTCPPGMTQVRTSSGDFCIDQYEASPGKGCRAPDPRNQEETLLNMSDRDCAVVSKVNAIPWRNVARHQAEELCARSGKRLPTSNEWYKAALGTPDSKSSVARNTCQVSSSGVRPTGESDICVSSVNAYDMVGNVWEWVEEIAIEGSYNGRELPQTGYVESIDTSGVAIKTSDASNANFNDDYFSVDHESSRGVMRGGYWGNGTDAGLYTVSIVAEPAFAGEGVGFRCVL